MTAQEHSQEDLGEKGLVFCPGVHLQLQGWAGVWLLAFNRNGIFETGKKPKVLPGHSILA